VAFDAGAHFHRVADAAKWAAKPHGSVGDPADVRAQPLVDMVDFRAPMPRQTDGASQDFKSLQQISRSPAVLPMK